MKHGLILLAGLFLVGPVCGDQSASGPSWDAHRRIEYQKIICATADPVGDVTPPSMECALALAKDGTWSAYSSKAVNRVKAGALALCRQISKEPDTCKVKTGTRAWGDPAWCVVDEGVVWLSKTYGESVGKKCFGSKKQAQSSQENQVVTIPEATKKVDSRIEKECFDLFHGPKQGAQHSWKEYIDFNNHLFLNRGDCDQFVSEDYSTWTAPLPSESQEKSSQDNQVATIPETTKTVDSPKIQSPDVVDSQPTEADKNIELEFWQSIKESNNRNMFREYLRQFPSGVYSGLAKIKLQELSADKKTQAASIPNLDYGDYYALVIGNNDYQDLTNLRSAVNDAKVVSTVLEVDYGFNVKFLENASRKDILRSLKHLRETVSAKDNVLIYYAGHGYLDEAADQGYWLPVDSERDDDSNWIATDRVVSQIKGMKAKHVMVVADSCFSGTITRAIKIEQRTPEWLSEIVKKKARTALTSGGLEPVMDTGSGNHSAFAYAFISLLEENDGVLDASQLFSKLRPKVMINSTQTPQYGKIHMAGDDGGDFLFVRQ
jgi:hypothetical protein